MRSPSAAACATAVAAPSVDVTDRTAIQPPAPAMANANDPAARIAHAGPEPPAPAMPANANPAPTAVTAAMPRRATPNPKATRLASPVRIPSDTLAAPFP